MKSVKKIYRTFLIAVGIVAVIISLFLLSNRTVGDEFFKDKAAVVYRSASCGCCKQYISYLRRAGLQVEEKITADMPEIRRQFGVTADLASCHTVRIGDYTVEGHIPVEAIQKLLVEKPDISGIALPGMPSGSPGMPGAKVAAFYILGFTSDGSVRPYVSL